MRTLTGILVCGVFLTFGTPGMKAEAKPESVPGYTQMQMSTDWYREQAALWKQVIEREPQNGTAWLNYFKASRYMGFGDTSVSQQEKAERMNTLVTSMSKAIPNSFEYHYVAWWNGGNNPEEFSHLEKAYQIRPDDAELSDDFVSYYELQGDKEQMQKFCRKWYATQAMSPALLNYHYNVLMSLEKNAVLVTSGDNDTYPVWLLQYAKGLRPDVTVLNTGLIGMPEYRTRILKENNIGGDPALLDLGGRENTDWNEAMAQFLKSVAEKTEKRPVYFALTAYPEYLSLIREDLYTVGLVSRYSAKRIDNIALLKKNWENYHLDYLDFAVYNENYQFNKQLLQQLNLNYITPAVVLYEHYMLAGDHKEAERMSDFALKLGRDADREDDVRNYISSLFSEISEVPDRTTEVESTRELPTTQDNDVLMYPNPAFSALTLVLPSADRADIQIVDMRGEVVYTTSVQQQNVTLNISGLATGTYMVRITTPQGTAGKTLHIVR
jgi:tetratricopeptide (TPR) repeat protein